MENLPSNLKALRRKRGLSQAALAIKAGVSRVAMIEAGKDNPSLSTLQSLADALNVSIHDLLCKKPRDSSI